MTSRPDPRTLTRSAGKPLWAQLRADLLRRLEDGEFRDVFPGEHDLVAEYQVSLRHSSRGPPSASCGRPRHRPARQGLPVHCRPPAGAEGR